MIGSRSRWQLRLPAVVRRAMAFAPIAPSLSSRAASVFRALGTPDFCLCWRPAPCSPRIPMLGDQIYIAGLLESAGKTAVGRTWMLDREDIMSDLEIGPLEFDDLRQQIEARMPGAWDRAASTDGRVFVYKRLCGSHVPASTGGLLRNGVVFGCIA